MAEWTHFSPLPTNEVNDLKHHCKQCPEIVEKFNAPEYDQQGLIYCRQVTCPHCGGEAPLLNTCWVSKVDGDKWGVSIIPDGQPRKGKTHFDVYRVQDSTGSAGQDPNFATVSDAVGTCIHCKQAIESDEIKAQARGESPFGKMIDRLYCVVSFRFQPKLGKDGKPVYNRIKQYAIATLKCKIRICNF